MVAFIPNLDYRYFFIFRCAEAVTRRCSVKNLFLKISKNSQENTCARVSFLIKLQAGTCNFIIKETLAQLFSCEFLTNFKDNFFYRHLRVTSTGCADLTLSILLLSFPQTTDPK